MIYKKYRSTILNKNQLALKITKHKMHKATHIHQRTTSLLPYTNKFTNTYNTYSSVKFTNDTAKDLACDGTNHHKLITKKTCVQNDYNRKKCPQLKINLKNTFVERNYTHNPLIGKNCHLVDNVDVHGNPKDIN